MPGAQKKRAWVRMRVRVTRVRKRVRLTVAATVMATVVGHHRKYAEEEHDWSMSAYK